MADFGLVVVAPHCQEGTAAEVRGVAQARGMRFTVTDGGGVVGSGGGIPLLMVFSHTGECVYEGKPDEKADIKIRTALGAALLDAANLTEPAKPLAPVIDALKKGGRPGATLTKLAPLRTGSDKPTAEQAKALTDAILTPAKDRLAAAEQAKADDPVGAYETAARIAAGLKNTPVGTKASELAAKWRNDKAVSAELKARPSLEQVRKLAAALDPKFGDPNFAKVFAAQLRQMKTLIQQMERNWPDAPATKEASGFGDKFGLK